MNEVNNSNQNPETNPQAGQPVNQSTNQQVPNKPIDKSVNQPVNKSVKKPVSKKPIEKKPDNFARNMLIGGILFVSVLIVGVLIYSVVSSEVDEQVEEASLNLGILKNSVKIEDDILTLSVEGDTIDENLQKIIFIIYDGITTKEVELDVADFTGEKDFEFDLSILGIDSSKDISVSMKPVVQSNGEEETLSILDKIVLSASGKVEKKKVEVTTQDTCGTICGEYSTQEECVTDRCNLNCEWDAGSITGNFILKLFTGRAVGGSCVEKTVTDTTTTTGSSSGTTTADTTPTVVDPVCGDGTCNGDETTETCPEDCPACTEGQTQACGTDEGECAVGEQTCSASNEWGDCGGATYVVAVTETCDGLDNDCDGVNDNGISTTATGCSQVGACSGAVKTCSAGSWSACSILPVDEVCGNSIDEDCDGSDETCITTSEDGESCSVGGDCTSGNCVDSVCCDTACSGGGCCSTGVCEADGTHDGPLICSSGSWINHCGNGVCDSNLDENCASCTSDCGCAQPTCCMSSVCEPDGTVSDGLVCSQGSQYPV